MNSTKQVTTRICDNCKKKVSDNGDVRCGRSVFSGWFEVRQIEGSKRIRFLRS